jgi:hypothetical protein
MFPVTNPYLAQALGQPGIWSGSSVLVSGREKLLAIEMADLVYQLASGSPGDGSEPKPTILLLSFREQDTIEMDHLCGELEQIGWNVVLLAIEPEPEGLALAASTLNNMPKGAPKIMAINHPHLISNGNDGIYQEMRHFAAEQDVILIYTHPFSEDGETALTMIHGSERVVEVSCGGFHLGNPRLTQEVDIELLVDSGPMVMGCWLTRYIAKHRSVNVVSRDKRVFSTFIPTA